MKYYLNILIILYVLNIITCDDPFDPYSFFTDEDLEIAKSLTDEQIDRGVGFIDVKQEFNPNYYGGDVVDEPKKRKDVHGYITKSSGRHWPNGRVPYQFVDLYTAEEKAHISKAIELLQMKTCIRFVARTPEDRYYIRFIKDQGCYSQDLGRLKYGPQNLSLGKGCVRVDIIIHELMHAIGFMHEFSRPDRDNYIQVNYQNMVPQAASQFKPLRGEYFGDWKLPFDIKSVMFYEGNAAAKGPGLTVMRAKDGQVLRCRPSECPTQMDMEKINTVYNCRGKGPDPGEVTMQPPTLRPPIEPEIPNEKTMCSLEWKSGDTIKEEIDMPVPIYDKSMKNQYVCRITMGHSKLGRNVTFTGFSDNYYGCTPLRSSWKYYNAEILVNNFQLPLKWIPKVRSGQNNGIIDAGMGMKSKAYIRRCADPNDTKCSQMEYLSCETNSFNDYDN